ncbi:MAG: vanadium-dependent haloperoxidase [Blastocatellales bacterium]
MKGKNLTHVSNVPDTIDSPRVDQGENHIAQSQPEPLDESRNVEKQSRTRSRRKFLGDVGGLTTAALVAGAAGIPSLESAALANVDGLDVGGQTGAARAEKAYNTRVQAALFQKIAPLPDHPNNGDENLYGNRIGNYSKGMPHNQLGEVDRNAYESLLKAVTTGDSRDFDAIILAGALKLTSPQAGLAFDMQGADPGHVYQPPAPAFASAEIASEIAENYWMALSRDVFFLDYESHPITIAAAEDLSKFSDFRGPKFPRVNLRRSPLASHRSGGDPLDEAQAQVDAQALSSSQTETEGSSGVVPRRLGQNSRVTPSTLFRSNTPGDLVGPYLSQFFWQEIPYGVQTISQKIRTVQPGVDYLTNYSDWLVTQNGIANFAYSFDSTPRYIRNLRDIAEWVHRDALFQAYFNAMLILVGTGVPVDDNNPYKNSQNQAGFATFGEPHLSSLLCGVAAVAAKAVWYQKWMVHRRLRPEEFAGRIHNHLTRATTYPIHSDILNSKAVEEVHRKYNSFLLPMAFPEGCPTHPAYGAGHATVAGVCVTILKAWFDESWIIQDPVVPSSDGLTLVPYRGSSLTVGGELNKLGANIAFARNGAGVHWRTDGWESLKFGEAMAISILQDFKGCYNERFDGFKLTKFDGTRVVIG